MTRVKITGLLLGLLAVASAGCQGKPSFASVEGTVTKAGKPLAGVIVDFYPDPGSRGPRSTSEPTDEVGHYRLYGSWGGDDGTVVGPHRVCILDARDRERRVSLKDVQKEVKERKESVPVSPRVPLSYGRPNETPLRAEVQAGPQTLDFDIP